jgi:hypothetical protein
MEDNGFKSCNPAMQSITLEREQGLMRCKTQDCSALLLAK